MGSSKKKTTVARTSPLFFEDRPIFGLDIGHSSVRVMQVHSRGKQKPRVIGYGVTSFAADAVENGVIVKPEVVAEATLDLFKNKLVGDITTRRVALSVPVSKAYIRTIDTPELSGKELVQAVNNEVEQYIPASPESLYIDYTQVKDGTGKSSIFVVAMPQKVVDSYILLSRLLGLEAVIVQTSIGSGAQLFSHDEQSDLPTLLVDFGSDSADITIYDRNPIVSGTAPCGGEQITQTIAKVLNVTEREAVIIKSRYGLTLSKKQAQIEAALKPTLGALTREIRRTLRYYEERNKEKRAIEQVVVMGGGANMPGLADYLTSDLRMPVRSFDPNAYIDFGKLQPISASERMAYVTAAGLALHNPREAFRL